jgi:hypothetical protein
MTTRRSKPCSITKCLVIPSSHHSLSCLEQTEDHCPKCLHLSFPFSCRRDKSFHKQNYCFQIWRLSWETNCLPTLILCNKTGQVLMGAERIVLPVAITLYEVLEVKFHSFLTSAIYGSEWSASRSDRFTSGTQVPGINWNGAWLCQEPPWEFLKMEIFLSPRGIKRPIHGRPTRSLATIKTTLSHACWQFKFLNILFIYCCFNSWNCVMKTITFSSLNV